MNYTKDEVRNKIDDIIEKNLSVKSSDFSSASHLADNLGADALDIIEICMDVENIFGISLSEDQCESITTVQSLYDLVFGIVSKD